MATRKESFPEKDITFTDEGNAHNKFADLSKRIVLFISKKRFTPTDKIRVFVEIATRLLKYSKNRSVFCHVKLDKMSLIA